MCICIVLTKKRTSVSLANACIMYSMYSVYLQYVYCSKKNTDTCSLWSNEYVSYLFGYLQYLIVYVKQVTLSILIVHKFIKINIEKSPFNSWPNGKSLVIKNKHLPICSHPFQKTDRKRSRKLQEIIFRRCHNL